MPLSSFLKRFRAGRADEVVASAATPSEEARTRARRRLIGAAVLVAAGVIGFPLLFDSQPRPLPSDLPIVMSHKDGGREVDVPRVASVARVDEPAAAARPVADNAAEASAPALPTAASTPVPAKPVVAAAAKPSAASAKPDVPAKPTSKPTLNDKSGAARAQALLNGQEGARPASNSARPASAAEVRYIVQVGAFADVPKAHEARMKVEKLGLKTYTQVVSGDEGKRIRVRVGPFPDKEAADKAAAKIRQAGLTAAILTL